MNYIGEVRFDLRKIKKIALKNFRFLFVLACYELKTYLRTNPNNR